MPSSDVKVDIRIDTSGLQRQMAAFTNTAMPAVRAIGRAAKVVHDTFHCAAWAVIEDESKWHRHRRHCRICNPAGFTPAKPKRLNAAEYHRRTRGRRRR